MSAALPMGVATRYKPGVKCAASASGRLGSGGGWIGSVMVIGKSSVAYLRMGLSALSMFGRPVLLLALLALAGCESGSTAQGGLPGLLDRVVKIGRAHV